MDQETWFGEAKGPAQVTLLKNGKVGHPAQAGPASKHVPFLLQLYLLLAAVIDR